MAKKKGAKVSKQSTSSVDGDLGYGNVDSAGNLVLDYQEFFGCTAGEMAEIIQRYSGEQWVGIGVDPHAGMGSFEAILEAVLREPSGVPVTVDDHVIVLAQAASTGNAFEYFDPADNGRRHISIDALRDGIRAAAVPVDLAQGITQTESEKARALEPAFG